MTELIELTNSEIEEVGGGWTGPNITLPNINIVLQGNLVVAPQTAVGIVVLSPNSNLAVSNFLLAWQGNGAVVG